MVSNSLMVFSGNANPKLALSVTQHLNIPLGRATVNRFSDGEVAVEINENVRGQDVFVLQSTCAPTNDNLMELMIMVDALRRASARRITNSVLRLCPSGSPSAFRPRGHQREGCCEHAAVCRC